MSAPNIYVINRGTAYIVAVEASSIASNSTDPIDKAIIQKLEEAQHMAVDGNALYKAFDFPKSLRTSDLIKSLSRFLASK